MRQSGVERTLSAVNYVLLALVGFITLFPFYYIIIYSLSMPDQALTGLYVFPKGITLTNYIAVFERNNILHAIFISASRAVVGTAVTVACCSMLAYGISKKVLPLRRAMYRLIILTMYFNVGLIPWYLTMRKLGLYNNFLLYILPSAIVTFFVILLKTFFEQLPSSLEESAMVDGAGYFTIYRRIVMPLSKPILATISLYQAIIQWNAWVDNYYLAPAEKLQTLQLLLYSFLTELSSAQNALLHNLNKQVIQVTPESIRMTITVIAVLPVLFIYPFMQRYFQKGILIGAIKG